MKAPRRKLDLVLVWMLVPLGRSQAPSWKSIEHLTQQTRLYIACGRKIPLESEAVNKAAAISFNAGGFGQEPIIDSKGSWAVGKFQVIDDLEIFLIDADDVPLDGTARFGPPFCAWFRCPSCAIAAFFLWVQRVAMG